MHIAIEGCCHGKLDDTYACLAQIEESKNIKIDLLLICGDFQAIRNSFELKNMNVPPKYKNMESFYKYYSGEKVAPVLTVVIGGNHESNLHFYELYHGGWLAPKIYFMGYAGVINYNGLRIAGLSGIYAEYDFSLGHFEKPPFSDKGHNVSVYHTREFDLLRLLQIRSKVHVTMTHDWPKNIVEHGNQEHLLRFKPYFEEDIKTGKFGSKAGEILLNELQSDYFFSAHFHWKYPAEIKHENGQVTKFLGLGKCANKAEFLQIIDLPNFEVKEDKLRYDGEWLAVLQKTMQFLDFERKAMHSDVRGLFNTKEFVATPEDIKNLTETFGDFVIPNNFVVTAPCFVSDNENAASTVGTSFVQNPQTTEFFKRLKVEDMFSERENLMVEEN